MNLYTVKNHFYPKTVLDLGANTGWFYRLAAREFPDAQFCLVDANPNCAGMLAGLGVEYHICVLSDSVKKVNFYTTIDAPTTTGASIYRENTLFFSDDKIVITEYETTTLDLLFNERQFDLIKMDVQGSELDIIRGGLQVVSRCKGLILELSSTNYNDGAPMDLEIIDYLSTIGFEQVEVVDGKNSDRPHHYDVLFLNKNL